MPSDRKDDPNGRKPFLALETLRIELERLTALASKLGETEAERKSMSERLRKESEARRSAAHTIQDLCARLEQARSAFTHREQAHRTGVQALEEKLARAGAELEKHRAEIQRIQAELAKSHHEARARASNIEARWRMDREALHAAWLQERAEFEGKIQSLQKELHRAAEQERKARAEIHHLSRESDRWMKLATESEAHAQESTRWKARAADADERARIAEDRMKAADDRVRTAENQMRMAESRERAAEDRAEKLAQELHRAREVGNQFNEKLNTEQMRSKSKEADLEKTRAQVEQAMGELSEARREIERLRKVYPLQDLKALKEAQIRETEKLAELDAQRLNSLEHLRREREKILSLLDRTKKDIEV